MKKFIFILILINFISLGCEKQKGSLSYPISQIPIKHNYEDGELTSKVYKSDSESDYEIELTMSRKGFNRDIRGVEFLDVGDYYQAKIKLPLEGDWDLNYIISNNEQTWTYVVSENFGSESEEGKYFIDINFSSDNTNEGEKGNFNIKILDLNGNVIKESEVNIGLYFNNKLKNSMSLSNKDGNHEFSYIFKENGIWKIKVNVKVSNNKFSKSYLIPIGEEGELINK